MSSDDKSPSSRWHPLPAWGRPRLERGCGTNAHASTVNVADYGAHAGSGEDAVPAVRRALVAAARLPGPVVLEFPSGRYDFHSEHSARRPYHVSNTVSETEHPDVTKTIAILIEGHSCLTIEGNGSEFIFHGRQTMLVLDRCESLRVRNVTFDFAHPTIAELTIEAIGDGWIDVQVHPATEYGISDEVLSWTGPGWAFSDGPTQVYDPVTDSTWRIDNPLRDAVVEELAPGRLRFRLSATPSLLVGQVLQLRDGLRDQVGIFAEQCRDVALEDVTIHYAHGLGIVAQFCENLSFDRLEIAPRIGSGRTAAVFADIIHLSGCRGAVRIVDSILIGSQDDAVNIHGTHLMISRRPSPDRLVTRFMHPQTYGIEAFFPGDEIAVVDSSTLLDRSTHRVVAVAKRSPREVELTLDSPVAEIRSGDVVENLTWSPEVEITRTHFARIPTRGVLVTTRRPVRIEDNAFNGLGLSGILIADDAASWYESGPVRDVTIRGNRFIECGTVDHPVISLAPENTVVDLGLPVHRNVTIQQNLLVTSGAAAVGAKSTRGLVVTDNVIVREAGSLDRTDDEFFDFEACSDVEITGNVIRATTRPS